MKLYLSIALNVVLLLSSCQIQQISIPLFNIDNQKYDSIKPAPNFDTETFITQTPYFDLRLEEIKNECISQSPVYALYDPPITSYPPEITWPHDGSEEEVDKWREEHKEREDYFKGKLQVTVNVGNASMEKLEFEAYEVYLDMFVTFSNSSEEPLIIKVPKSVSHSIPGFDFIHVDYKDENDNLILNYYMAPPHIIHEDITDFVLLNPGESYCKYYTDYFLLSDNDDFLIDDERITLPHMYPGTHWIKIYYDNFSGNYDGYFVNSWIGLAESDWVSFEIKLAEY